MSRPKSPRRSHSPTVSTSTTTTNIENHNHSHDDLDPISPVLQPIATIPTRPQNLTNCSSRLTRTGSILNGSLVLVRTTTNPANIIPRDQRRGILGRSKIVWIPEIRDPYEYTNAVKFTITLIVGLAGASAPMGSSVLFPALGQIAKAFDKPATIANLTVALYMASMAICPLYWSRFSERSGRRTVYILSFTLFILFSLGAALAPIPHIWFLILMRMGIGGSAGAVQSVGAGTISDIWEVHQRGKAMGWFYLGPLMGPLIAPLIGGGLTSKWGWRATQWFILIFAVVIFCGLVTSLPETLRRKDAPKVRVETVDDLDVVGADIDVEERKVGGNENGDHGRDNELDGTLTNNTPNSTTQDLASGEVLEKRKTTNIDNLPGNNAPDIDNQIPPSQKSRWNRIYHGIIDPFLSLKYLLYPPVALTVGYSTFAYMCVYVLNTSMQSTLSSPPYNYSPGTVGLFYIPPALGNFTGSIIGGRWTDRIMKRQARKRQRKGEGNGEFIPEDRMKENALLGGILFPLSLLCYGWTVKRYSFWLVPVFPTAFFGFGSMLLFGMCTTMLTEFVPGKSSSAVAVQNFIRNIFACISSSVTATLLNALGPAILFTIMGGIGLCCLAIPLIMKTYGPRWRENVGRYDLS